MFLITSDSRVISFDYGVTESETVVRLRFQELAQRGVQLSLRVKGPCVPLDQRPTLEPSWSTTARRCGLCHEHPLADRAVRRETGGQAWHARRAQRGWLRHGAICAGQAHY